MSSSVELELGKSIKIRLQLKNRSISKFPKATVISETGIDLGSVNLNHVQNGFYLPATPFLMPNEPSITVQYQVFDDAARVNDSGFGSTEDTFLLKSSGGTVVNTGLSIKVKSPELVVKTLENNLNVSALPDEVLPVRTKQVVISTKTKAQQQLTVKVECKE